MKTSATFKTLEDRIITFRNQRDWKQFHTPRTLATSLVLEAAELLEIFQWIRDTEVEEHAIQQWEPIREELADIAIYLIMMAHDLDIDLAAAVEHKMELNAKKYPLEKAKGNARKYTEFRDERDN